MRGFLAARGGGNGAGDGGVAHGRGPRTWEKRAKRKVYYRARRVGRKVVKIHIGTGKVGLAAEHADALRRADRDSHKASQAREKAAIEEARAASRALAELCSLLAEATLLTGGYHRPGRHEWRRWHAAWRAEA